VLIQGYRAALFNQPFNWPALLIATLITLLLLAYATTVFRKMEEQFADLV
jgi:ABC-type polysaccharide/polyol phosphate export permease